MRFEDLKETFFVVQATNTEVFNIWKEWNEAIPMEQDGQGFGEQVGRLDGRPIMVSLFRYRIWNKWVVFYESTSQVVDYRLVEGWIQKNVLIHTPDWDNGRRQSHCNSDNFHLCVNALEEATGQKRKDIWSDEARLEIVAAELTQLIERVGRKPTNQQ